MQPDVKRITGALFFLFLSLVYGIYALRIQLFVVSNAAIFTARSMPITLSIIGAVCSVLYLITAFIQKPGKQNAELNLHNWKLILTFFLLMTAYGFALRWLGFIISTILFLYAGAYTLNERRWKKNAAVSVVTVMFFWLIIGKVLNIYLVQGELWEMIF